MKCAWIYLCDKCDHAGIWTSDFDALSFFVGEEVTDEEVTAAFGDKIERVKYDKFLIQAFIDFQYGTLNPENRVHLSVISKLEKEGANKGLKRTLKGPKDKDKDKDKDLDKEKDKEKEAQISKIYSDHYPLKKGKSDGIKAAMKKLKTEADLEAFKAAVIVYAEDCRKKGTDPKYIKGFESFVNSTWRDLLDPEFGKSTVTPIRQTKAQQVESNLHDLWNQVEEEAKLAQGEL